ncbi:MAG: protein kinase [bacterium]|nr:protein kinase [bacterium]
MMVNETVNIKMDRVLKAVLEKLEGKYRYIMHLGGGEFSNVYLVKHTVSEEEFALKIMDYHYLLQKLRKEDLQDSKRRFNEIKKRFFIEAKLYEKIDHPNIVKILATGTVLDESKEIEIPYLIMDYIKGSSLADVLKKEAPFEMSRVIRLSQNLLGVLDIIHHNNIIHRDIKPANIMIREETGEAVIIDFGIAKDIVSGTRLTTTGALLGSPVYMAPEQFVDSSKVGPETDIYSFGVVLYEMLAGESPFRGGNFLEIMNAHRQNPVPDVREKNPALPHYMAHVLARAMAKDPNERYRDAKELLDALEKEDGAIPGKKRGHLMPFFLLATALIVVVGVIVFFPTGSNEKKDKPPPPIAGEKKTETPDPTKPKVITAENQQENMNRDFKALQTLLNGDAAENEKVNRCLSFLKDYKDIPGAGAKITETTRLLEQLQTGIADARYQELFAAAKKYLDENDFQNAGETLAKAREIKDTDEVKQLSKDLETQKSRWENLNGTEAYRSIIKNTRLAQYLAFVKKYPGSVHIPDLKTQLKKTEPGLPPGSYWERAIQKNSQGYYEFTFGPEHNRHRMIYLPAKGIWIDKYEVANLSFKTFSQAEKIPFSPGQGSRIIRGGVEFPAVVRFGDAERYCIRYGLRLPSLDEWEYAAGKGTFTYPWGNEAPDHGGQWRANFDSLEGNEDRDGFNGTAPVNAFAQFSSPFGAVNMAGNVWEWVQGRILKGGGFISPKEDLEIKKNSYARENEREGFRCVKDETEKQGVKRGE